MCLHSLLSELSFRQGFETCLRIVSEGNAWFGFPGGRVGISSRRNLAQSEPLALTAPRWGSSVKARVGQCGAFWGFFGQQPRAEQESVCQSSFSAGVNGSSCSHWWQWHRERVTLNVPRTQSRVATSYSPCLGRKENKTASVPTSQEPLEIPAWFQAMSWTHAEGMEALPASRRCAHPAMPRCSARTS